MNNVHTISSSIFNSKGYVFDNSFLPSRNNGFGELDGYGYTLFKGISSKYEAEILLKNLFPKATFGNGFHRSTVNALDIIPLHQDEIYLGHPSKYLALYCIENSIKGGQTLFHDTVQAASILKKEDINFFDFLKGVEVTWGSYYYKNLTARKTLIANYNGDDILNWSYSKCIHSLPNCVINYNYINERIKKSINKSLVLSHQWQEGDLLIWDNLRYVHQKLSNVGEGRRELVRWRFTP